MSNSRIIEYHLEEIDAWRRGDRGTPGQPSTGSRYALAMKLAIKDHEEKLIALGHEPTINYVRDHGFADGAFKEPAQVRSDPSRSKPMNPRR